MKVNKELVHSMLVAMYPVANEMYSEYVQHIVTDEQQIHHIVKSSKYNDEMVARLLVVSDLSTETLIINILIMTSVNGMDNVFRSLRHDEQKRAIAYLKFQSFPEQDIIYMFSGSYKDVDKENPAQSPNECPPPDDKISIRDDFAGKAMQGIVGGIFSGTDYWKPENIAKEAYAIADAMLAEREKQNH